MDTGAGVRKWHGQELGGTNWSWEVQTRAEELKEGVHTQVSNSNSRSNSHRAITAAASAVGVVGHAYGSRNKGRTGQRLRSTNEGQEVE